MKILSAAILCAALGVSGCAGGSLAAGERSLKALKSGDYTNCVKESKEATAAYEAEYVKFQTPGPHYSPGRTVLADHLMRMSRYYHALAMCEKALKMPDAFSDMEKSILHATTYCQKLKSSWDYPIGEKTCRQAADDTELLARWKKEAALTEAR